MNWLARCWYSYHPFCYLLTPLSALYRLSAFIRRCCYRIGLKKTTRFPIPILVVGNITVGGTGKTPLVIWLTHFLREQGYRPGIVSRGYGGYAENYPQHVIADSDPKMVSDEAVLLVQQTQCPMVVDPDRVNAVKTLLANSNCNIVVSDDGLQHYAMGRDIEIAVIDGMRRYGNGFCLPAGPLRESVNRLRHVNFIVANGKAEQGEYKMSLIPGSIYNLAQPNNILDPVSYKFRKIHAVAGIGHPERFFNLLRQLGFTVIEHPFPDHYLYRKDDFDFEQDAVIVMTEKDAVKCKKFADERFWSLPANAEVDERFGELLLQKISALQNTLNKSLCDN